MTFVGAQQRRMSSPRLATGWCLSGKNISMSGHPSIATAHNMVMQQDHQPTEAARDGTLPKTAVFTITCSPGPRTNAVGHRHAVVDSRPAAAIANLLESLPGGEEVWWSPNLWRGDRRSAKRWEGACAVVLDLDFHDAAGRHCTCPDDARRGFDENAHRLPINLVHPTPRGARLIILLERAVSDHELYVRATTGAMATIENVLAAIRLSAEKGRAGYAVDAAARDLARFFYAPRATVSGHERQASVRLVRDEPFAVELLAAPVVAAPVVETTAPAAPARLSAEYREATRRWNEDHHQDWGPPGQGECPGCGHHGCFGRLPERPEKWTCFSTGPDGHAARTLGKCGHESASGHWFGDALDFEAYRRGSSRRQVLIEDGYFAGGLHRARDVQ
jgi:hypothetical protein